MKYLSLLLFIIVCAFGAIFLAYWQSANSVQSQVVHSNGTYVQNIGDYPVYKTTIDGHTCYLLQGSNGHGSTLSSISCLP